MRRAPPRITGVTSAGLCCWTQLDAELMAFGQACRGKFNVFVGKEDFKFNAAHFVAFRGYRERLHGHNYHVAVRLTGQVRGDGYVVDFGDVKKATRKICKELNEHFICPCHSDVLQIATEERQLSIRCEDGTFFSFPEADCVQLPIAHSTAEELAIYIWRRLYDSFGSLLRERGVTVMEITVSEMPNQSASFELALPPEGESLDSKQAVFTSSGTPDTSCSQHRVRADDASEGDDGSAANSTEATQEEDSSSDVQTGGRAAKRPRT